MSEDRTSAAQQALPVQDAFLAYDGNGARLFELSLKMAFLSLITAGIYRFWGKTGIRRYLWSGISLAGDRLDYRGTGKELFLGFLVALAILIPLGIVIGLVQYFFIAQYPEYSSAFEFFIYVLFSFLYGIAYFRARRYRLSRTGWRGIRFSQSGSSVRYALRLMGCFVATILTLGILAPLTIVVPKRYELTNTRLGNQRFEFDGRTTDMLAGWIPCLLLAPFTLGLSMVWFAAYSVRYTTSKTRFAGLEFELPVTFRDYFRIYAPYYLFWIGLGILVFFTAQNPAALIILAIAAVLVMPGVQLVLVTHRMIRLVAEKLSVTGAADLDSIVQGAEAGPRTGEGLADALDVGGGIEIGF